VSIRGRRLTIAALVLSAAPWAAAAPAGAAAAPAPSQPLAELRVGHTVYAAPRPHARKVESVSARRPITEQRTVLPVLAERRAAGASWLRVRLPGRPNGHSGWIRADGTTARSTPWHIVVDRSRREVVVYRAGHRERSGRAIVGKPSTPTPIGQFFVEEGMALRPTDVGGPYALALSARSNVLQEFAGGPGQVALHGRDNIGGVLGTDVSHGCVRLSNQMMRWLIHRIGSGVPVTIQP
jgi:lipoprotein-anchoring transpeptidase ErfK/SrfK